MTKLPPVLSEPMLRRCDECHGRVSDKASACPHCGAPTQSWWPEFGDDSDDDDLEGNNDSDDADDEGEPPAFPTSRWFLCSPEPGFFRGPQPHDWKGYENNWVCARCRSTDAPAQELVRCPRRNGKPHRWIHGKNALGGHGWRCKDCDLNVLAGEPWPPRK